MPFFRWMLGLPLAALVTAALFFMMAGLIAQKTPAIADSRAAPDLKIVTSKKDSPPDDRDIKPPILDQNPPDAVIPKTLPGTRPDVVPVNPDRQGVGEIEKKNGSVPTPVIRQTPLYPDACRARGAEGDVVVQFDVTPEGNVVNIQILNSPHRCFERPVRNAVSRWKYPPLQENGRNVMRRGVIERIRFELTQ